MHHRSVLLHSAMALALVACRSDDPVEPDVTTSVDHVFASLMVMKVLPLAHTLHPTSGQWHLLQDRTCAAIDSITGDTAAFPLGGPVTVYLKYPDEGCPDLDGRLRSGRLSIKVTAPMDEEGAVTTVRSGRFGMAGFAHRFAVRATCIVPGAWEVDVDTSDMFWQGDWSRRLRGRMNYTAVDHAEGTPAAAEQQYTVTHTLSGGDRLGTNYSTLTSSALVIANDCNWVLSGVEVLTPSGRPEQVVDHGGGACDARSTITTSGRSIGLTSP